MQFRCTNYCNVFNVCIVTLFDTDPINLVIILQELKGNERINFLPNLLIGSSVDNGKQNLYVKHLQLSMLAKVVRCTARHPA